MEKNNIATIELSKEQKAMIAKELGVICDELVISDLKDLEKETKNYGDLTKDFLLARGKSHKIS